MEAKKSNTAPYPRSVKMDDRRWQVVENAAKSRGQKLHTYMVETLLNRSERILRKEGAA